MSWSKKSIFNCGKKYRNHHKLIVCRHYIVYFVNNTKHIEDILPDLRNTMITNSFEPDVVFVVDGWKFPGHKQVLKISNEQFFIQHVEPFHDYSEIVMENVDARGFQQFIRFCHFGDVNLNSLNMMPTYDVAKTYNNSELVKICTNFICDEIGLSNVLEIMDWNINHEDYQVTRSCRGFFIENCFEVLKQTDQFKKISKKLLKTILNYEILNCSEKFLFKQTIEWAAEQCKLTEIEPTTNNKKNMIEDVLYLIRLEVSSNLDVLNDFPTSSRANRFNKRRFDNLIVQNDVDQTWEELPPTNEDLTCFGFSVVLSNLGSINDNFENFLVTIECGCDLLLRKEFKITVEDHLAIKDFVFNKPILLEKHKRHVLKVKFFDPRRLRFMERDDSSAKLGFLQILFNCLQMKLKKLFQPRIGDTHGLFGVKYLKYHNLRDSNWTAEDLITQYEKLSNIYRKANNNADLQRDQDEKQTVQEYKRLKKGIKDKQEFLYILLKGDKQRTKNVLQDHTKYQRTYQNLQSYEVLERLENQVFLKSQKLNRIMSERNLLMEEYEAQLMEVAKKQEMVRYFDVTEFKQERDTKRLFVELKNSETRTRAIEKINSSYKKIIDQLLHDSLYYKPVLDALNSDWDEQTMLVEQTIKIGLPAIKNVKKLEKGMKNLSKIHQKEEDERYAKISENRQYLKSHPATVKKLVRRDSDFSRLGSRYDRDTKSMTDLKVEMHNAEATIKLLKRATRCITAEEIQSRVEKQPEFHNQIMLEMNKQENVRKSINEESKMVKFLHDMLLDDCPQIFNNEKFDEIAKLDTAVMMEKEKQKNLINHVSKRRGLLMLLRLALQHFLDVLRHVGTSDAYNDLEYPTVDLKLALLNFNPNMPTPPMVMETNHTKLLSSVKSRVQILMQVYQKESTSLDIIEDTKAMFQQAMIEDFIRNYRPRKLNLDFD